MSNQFPYPFPERFRSRLMLRYRTRISGTEAQKKLPFRLLVLGNFTGDHAHAEGEYANRVSHLPSLYDRPIRSYVFGVLGARVDKFMGELLPYVKLEPWLATDLPGTITNLQLTGALPASKAPEGAPESVQVKLSGSASFASTEDQNGLCKVAGKLSFGAQVELVADSLPTMIDAGLGGGGKVRGLFTIPARDEPVGVVAGVVETVGKGERAFRTRLYVQKSEQDDTKVVATPITMDQWAGLVPDEQKGFAVDAAAAVDRATQQVTDAGAQKTATDALSIDALPDAVKTALGATTLQDAKDAADASVKAAAAAKGAADTAKTATDASATKVTALDGKSGADLDKAAADAEAALQKARDLIDFAKSAGGAAKDAASAAKAAHDALAALIAKGQNATAADATDARTQVRKDVATRAQASAEGVKTSSDALNAAPLSPIPPVVPNGKILLNAERVLPFDSIASFNPDTIASNIPELNRLGIISELLGSLKSELRNVPALRDTMRAALENDTSGLLALQAALQPGYQQLAIVKPAAPLAASAGGPPGAPPELQRAVLSAVGSSMGETVDKNGALALVKLQGPAPQNGAPVRYSKVEFRDHDVTVSDGARLMNELAALLLNVDIVTTKPTGPLAPGSKLKLYSGKGANLSELLDVCSKLSAQVDRQLSEYLDDIYHAPGFQELERNWKGLEDLCQYVQQENIVIDFLDVTREELRNDFLDHDSDIFSSALFRKVYIEEYDRYGGEPFATMLGLYEFEDVRGDGADIRWLRTMSKIAASAHCPFLASANSKFIGKDSMQDVADLADLDAVLSNPKYGKWDAFRDEDYAAYIGLILPRYLVRTPWGSTGEPELGNEIAYEETVHPERPGDENNFLWGNPVVLFGKNLIRSYATSEWAQHIRGPKGGGRVDGLTVFSYTRKDDEIVYGKKAIGVDGKEEFLPPVEIVIPDYREYQFARNGLIALVHKKGEAVATFFSAQSVKKGRNFLEDVATKNSFLVTNLAYTYSITIIAHYVKAMVRDYIGSTADGDYIQKSLAEWLSGYVTTVTNPDDLTLRYYPFKATSVTVEPKPGPFGWYKSVISVLPHVQFEGMDVELRLEASLGGK